MKNHRQRTEAQSEKIFWSRVSIGSNAFLMLLKLLIGILIVSISVISEGLHTSLDLLAAIIAAYSVQIATEPADKEHRFGHGKYENFSGTVQAVMIFAVSVVIIIESCITLYNWHAHGVEKIQVDLGILVMLVSTVVNYAVGRKLHVVAKKYDSLSIEANAYHLTADVYTSFGVFAGLIAIKAGEYLNIANIYYLDPIIAIVIAVFILKVAVDLTRRSMHGLLDGRLPEQEEKVIHDTIREHYSQYVEYHEMRSRKAGSERHVDLHLVVAKDISIEKAHDICDHLEKDIETNLANTKIIIHCEPCDGKCRMCRLKKNHNGECEANV